MTVPPPPERAIRRTLRTRAVAAAGALAIAVVPLLGGLPASAATPTPTPSPTPDVPTGTTVFTLSPVGDGIVRAGDPLTVSTTLQNGTDAATAPVTVVLSLGAEPLQDRDDLTAWLDGDATGVQLSRVGVVALEGVPAGEERTRGIGVPATDPALQNRAPGVYPLRATYQGASGPVSSVSTMIVPDPSVPATGIGVVVPITTGALSAGLLTVSELSDLTAPDGALTSQLDAVQGTSAILAVDPAIPAAIRVLGSSAPESALAWLDRLESLPETRFALQFGDADVAVQLKAGIARPLQPTSLTAYMNPDDFSQQPEPTPEPTPTPTPTTPVDPDAPDYPDLATLLDIGGGRTGVFWPAAGAAGADTVEKLGALTVDDQSSLTLVPSLTTEQGASGGTVTAHAHAGDADLLVYDSDVSRALQQASLEDEGALRGAPLTEATAYLAFATADADGAPLLVTLERDTTRSRVGLRSAITTATQAPGVAAETLGRLTTATPIDVKIADADIDPARVAATSALAAEESSLARFATILDDPSLLTGPERAEILQLLGIAWIPSKAPWTAAVAAHRTETTATLNSVDLLPTSTINLFGSGADLGFWVRNDLPYPVNLILYTTPDNLRLDVQRATPVVAGAASNTRVEVPVQARVGNGEVTLSLQLRSRASVAIGQGATVEVNVRAEWESVGIVVLAVVVGGLLLLGVVRTVLRLRSARKAKKAPDAADAPADAESPAPADSASSADRADAEDRS